MRPIIRRSGSTLGAHPTDTLSQRCLSCPQAPRLRKPRRLTRLTRIAHSRTGERLLLRSDSASEGGGDSRGSSPRFAFCFFAVLSFFDFFSFRSCSPGFTSCTDAACMAPAAAQQALQCICSNPWRFACSTSLQTRAAILVAWPRISPCVVDEIAPATPRKHALPLYGAVVVSRRRADADQEFQHLGRQPVPPLRHAMRPQLGLSTSLGLWPNREARNHDTSVAKTGDSIAQPRLDDPSPDGPLNNPIQSRETRQPGTRTPSVGRREPPGQRASETPQQHLILTTCRRNTIRERHVQHDGAAPWSDLGEIVKIPQAGGSEKNVLPQTNFLPQPLTDTKPDTNRPGIDPKSTLKPVWLPMKMARAG